jgi:YD repeat-containing protein
MKFYSTLAAAALLLVGASSCKKNNDDLPVQPETVNQKRLVKTNMHGGEFLASYNADGSIKEFTIPVENIKTTFAYNGNVVTQTRFKDNIKLWEFIIVLANGKVFKSSNTSFDNQGNVNSSFTAQYFYNASGQLEKEDYSTGLRHEYEYDANGNMKACRTYQGADYNYREEYEYFLDKKEKWMSFNLMNGLGWGAFHPPFSKNLRKRKVFIDMQTQQVTYDLSYTYELDQDGYVLKGKYVNQFNGTGKEWTNVYE